jgi:YD repeat-containing protein
MALSMAGCSVGGPTLDLDDDSSDGPQIPPDDDISASPDAGLAVEDDVDAAPVETGPGWCDVEVELPSGTRTVYNYDDDGRLMTKTSYYTSSTSAREYEWSEDGLEVVESTEYGSSYTRSYEDLPTGRRIRTYTIGSYLVTFNYNADGELKSAITKNADGETTRTRTFTSTGSRVTSVRDITSIGDRRTDFIYSGGRLVRTNYRSVHDGPVTYAVHFRRDASGKIYKTEDDSGNDGSIDDYEDLRYDGPGCDSVDEGWWLSGKPGLEQ